MDTLFNTLWDAPMSTRGFFTLNTRDNTVEVSGLKTGKTTVIGWATTPGLGMVVTLHEEGGKHWARRGEQTSHPASTYTILVEQTDRFTFRYVRLSTPVESTNAATRAAKTGQFILMAAATAEEITS